VFIGAAAGNCRNDVLQMIFAQHSITSAYCYLLPALCPATNRQGVLVVAAAGNSGDDGLWTYGSPASEPDSIAVGSTDNAYSLGAVLVLDTSVAVRGQATKALGESLACFGVGYHPQTCIVSHYDSIGWLACAVHALRCRRLCQGDDVQYCWCIMCQG
jgi:hypothetical protein